MRDLLIGDPRKSKKLDWTPQYDLPALVKYMMKSDLKLMQKDRYLQDRRFKTLNYFE